MALVHDERLHHYPWCLSNNMTVTRKSGKSVIEFGECDCALGQLVKDFLKQEEKVSYGIQMGNEQDPNDVTEWRNKIKKLRERVRELEQEVEDRLMSEQAAIRLANRREEERDASIAVLSEIAGHGCGCGEFKPGTVPPKVYTCRDRHPGDREEWCWSCIAAAALEGREP